MSLNQLLYPKDAATNNRKWMDIYVDSVNFPAASEANPADITLTFASSNNPSPGLSLSIPIKIQKVGRVVTLRLLANDPLNLTSTFTVSTIIDSYAEAIKSTVALDVAYRPLVNTAFYVPCEQTGAGLSDMLLVVGSDGFLYFVSNSRNSDGSPTLNYPTIVVDSYRLLNTCVSYQI